MGARARLLWFTSPALGPGACTFCLGVISKFHTLWTNERTFIWEGGGLNPIRCAIDSKKKKKKKKKKKTQSCCGACTVKSPKKKKSVASRSHDYLISKAAGLHIMVDQSQMMSISLLEAPCSTPSGPTPPVRFYIGMQKKGKRRRKLKSRSSTVRDCLPAHFTTLNLQGSVPARARQTALKHVHVGAGGGEEGYFFRTPSNDYERFVNAFVGRERRLLMLSWTLHLRAICHTFLPLILSITLSFEEGGRGKVPYESSFVCPQCANF